MFMLVQWHPECICHGIVYVSEIIQDLVRDGLLDLRNDIGYHALVSWLIMRMALLSL